MATKPKASEKDQEDKDVNQEAQDKNASGASASFDVDPGASIDPAAADLQRVLENEPKPGDPGMVPAYKDAVDPNDPSKEGVRNDLTPLDTRNAGDAPAGRSDADTVQQAGRPDSRNRNPGAKDGGASLDVADGGRGVPTPSVDDMTDDECKSFLMAYGMDAPVGQARNLLKSTILRGMASQKAR